MDKFSKIFYHLKNNGLRGVIRQSLLYLVKKMDASSRSRQTDATGNKSDLELIKPNRSIKNTCPGERCFIIGSGPSLKKLDLTLLADDYYIGVNAVYLNPQLPRNAKSLWCTMDTFVKPFIDMTDHSVPWLKALESATSKETRYFFPVQARDFCQKNGLFTGRQINYLAFGDTIGLNEPEPTYYSDRLELDAPLISPHNIIETAVTCAAYMGFRKIYLIGCDSDWFLYDDLNINHFYTRDPRGLVETQNGNDKKKDYFVMDTREKKLFYSYLLYRNYRLLRDALEPRGVQIINASGGGMLDMFPKEDFHSLFAK